MNWRNQTDYHGSRSYAPDQVHEVHDDPLAAPSFGSWLRQQLNDFLKFGAAESAISIDLMRDEQGAFPLFEPAGQSGRRNADVGSAFREGEPRVRRLGTGRSRTH